MIMSNLNSKLIFQNNYLNRTQDKTRHTFYNYLCVASNLLFLIFSVHFSENVSNFTFEPFVFNPAYDIRQFGHSFLIKETKKVAWSSLTYRFRIARASVRVGTLAPQDESPHLTTADCTPIIVGK